MRSDQSATDHPKLAPFALHIGRRDLFLGVLVAVLSVVGIIGGRIGLTPVLVFVISGVALALLAYGIGVATDELGATAGPRISGVLNATFGNIAELVIAGFALRAGLLEIVRASIAGSVLGNTLLVLGLCMIVGGWRHGVQRFSKSCGLDEWRVATRWRGRPHRPCTTAHHRRAAGQWQRAKPLGGRVPRTALRLSRQSALLPDDTGSGRGGARRDAHWGWGSATIILGVLALLTAPVADAFVNVLDPTARALGLPALFLGLVIVPLVGNIPENLVGLTVAWRGDMDFAMVIALGSSLQIALMVGPILALISPLLGHPLTLVFAPVEIVAIAAGALLMAVVAVDGESTWIEGLALVAVYIIFAAAIYVWPVGAL